MVTPWRMFKILTSTALVSGIRAAVTTNAPLSDCLKAGLDEAFRGIPWHVRDLDLVASGRLALEGMDHSSTSDRRRIKVHQEEAPSLEDVVITPLEPSCRQDSPKSLPVCIRPKKDSSLKFMKDFMRANKSFLNDKMLQHGAVYFRGFDIETSHDVEAVLQAYEPNLSKEYRGTSPRSPVDGAEYVFSAADVPSHYPIAQHLEMSFLPAPPRKLFFCALVAPQQGARGGETTLSDFCQVYRDLSPALRYKLATKKIKYTRTHYRKGARFTHDVTAMQSWADVFGTSDKAEIEEKARREKLPMRWEGRDGNTFVSEFVSEPFQLHPDTGDAIWFNHAQVFHWTTFPSGLFLAFQRTKDWRYLARAIMVGVTSFVQYRLLGQKMGLHISFGDDTQLSMQEMREIRRAINKNMIYSRWQKGDLVMIDNFRMSHGRQPTYDSGRQIVVAWSDVVQKTDRPVPQSMHSLR